MKFWINCAGDLGNAISVRMIFNLDDILPLGRLIKLLKHIIPFRHPRSRRTKWESPPSTERKEFRRDGVVNAEWAGCLIHNYVIDRLSMSSQYALDWKSVVGFFSHNEMATKCQFGSWPAQSLVSFSDSSSAEATCKRSWLGRIPQQAQVMASTEVGGWYQMSSNFGKSYPFYILLLYWTVINLAHTWPQRATNEIIINYITDLTKISKYVTYDTIWKFQKFLSSMLFQRLLQVLNTLHSEHD